MKNFILIIFTLTSVLLSAQEKVIEASSKKSPQWVNGMTEDYIIISAYGTDIDEAKQNLQIKLREEIVNAVATYVRSESEMYIENTQKGTIINTVEQFKKTSSIQTGDIPFLKGISLSKATDFYWAKSKNKNTGKISVIYHVKYPFTKADLKRLTMEFEAQDRAMTKKMEDIIALSKSPKTVEDLRQYQKQLEQLNEYFIDSRKETTQLEITRIKETFNLISISVLENSPGLVRYQLVIGEVPIGTAQKPRVKGSLCVQSIITKKSGVENTVEYNYENCFEDEENNLTIEHSIGNNRISQKLPISLSETKVELFVKDAILFSKKESNETEILSFTVKIPLVTKYDGAFAVNKISLELTDSINLEIADIFEEFDKKGIHDLIIEVEKTILVKDFNKLNGTNINGEIYYTSIETGETLRYKMINQALRINN